MTAIPTSNTIDDVIKVDKREEGSSIYGLFLTVLLFDTTDEKLVTEERYFLAQHMLCKYTRDRGVDKAPWNAYPLDSYATVRDLLQKCMERHNENEAVKMVMTVPILVELNRTDIEALSAHKQPYSRHDGQRAFERLYGEPVTDAATLGEWA